LEFNVPFQHKYGYIRDDFKPGMKSEEVRGVDGDELIENDDLIAV